MVVLKRGVGGRNQHEMVSCESFLDCPLNWEILKQNMLNANTSVIGVTSVRTHQTKASIDVIFGRLNAVNALKGFII